MAIALHVSRLTLLACTASFTASAYADSNQNFATDDNRFDGDHLRFRTNAYGFKEKDGKPKCAPAGSKLAVIRQADNGDLLVRFYEVRQESDYEKKVGNWDNVKRWFDTSFGEPLSRDAMDRALVTCKADRVDTTNTYTVSKADLAQTDYLRTGVTFGGLVVPFKYRLGGDRGIITSATIAPYVGFRTGLGSSWGLSFTPIFSAGLGLVPVTDASTSKTETRPALSLATGFRMGSSKNDKFSSGLIFGRDLLSKSDRDLDPNVNKWWVSFYLGASL